MNAKKRSQRARGMASRKEVEQEPEFDLTGYGIGLEQMKTDPMVLELALARVRRRHEFSGDADKFTFELLI